MTPHELSWFVFGAGAGALAAMFGTGYLLVRRFEEELDEGRRRGGSDAYGEGASGPPEPD